MSTKFDRIQWFPLWPTLCAFYFIWLFNEKGPSTFRIIGAGVIGLWFLGAWFNAFTRGRLIEWLYSGDDDDPLPDIPTSFAAYEESLEAPTPLQQTLADGIAGRRDLEDALRDLALEEIDSADDATAVCVALEDSRDNATDCWRAVLPLLQIPGSTEVYAIYYHQALPVLHRLYLTHHQDPDEDLVGDLMFALKQFTAYGYAPAFRDIAAAARNPTFSDHHRWEIIVRSANGEDPDCIRLMETLASPLPENFAGVAYLDWCNQWAIEDIIPSHPFDSDAGVARLETHLSDSDPEHETFAVSAAAALPFLKHANQARLLTLARNHTIPHVRLEAAWAMAHMKLDEGKRDLAAATLDWRIGHTAVGYLEELDLQHLVPPEALEPKHAAISKMADWLSHPNELGSFPETLEIVDQRELFWPATGQRELQTLLRWKLEGSEGICWTGSSTWALFSESEPVRPVLDHYAMYSSWHMKANALPNAPESYSDLEAGRTILTTGNPGQDWTPRP